MNRKTGNGNLSVWVAAGMILLCQVEVSLAQTQSDSETYFSDIQGHWAQGCIQALARREIVGGNLEDDRFRPDEPMKRVELAIILSQAFPNVEPVRDATNFADIPTNYWAYDAIRDADRKGFLSGYIAGAFNPKIPVSRTQVLTALTEGLNYQPRLLSGEQLDLIFTDADRIPEPAQTAIAAATENGLVVNYPDVTRLNPNQPATRAEVATFICQALSDSRQSPLISSEYIPRISASELANSTPESVVLNAKKTEAKPEVISSKPEPTPEITPPDSSESALVPAEEIAASPSPSESSSLIPEIPESLEATARSNDVEALLFYEMESEYSGYQKLRLQIVRRGILKFNEAILLIANQNNQPSDQFLGVDVQDLNEDKEPEVILDFKINSPNSPVYYSIVYRYSPIQGEYIPLRQDWGTSPPERLQQQDNTDV
ncbi:MAG: S-layer homology domain-containing protein [Cyanobacteria bacterium J06592_8]